MRTLRSASSLMLLGTASVALAETPPHARIMPGMTITDVQALLGPPYAIKSLRWNEAMFFCPASWWGIPVGDLIYTTVWLSHRRVIASRTIISATLGTCETFMSAFQWTDPPPFPAALHTHHSYSRTRHDPSSWAKSTDPVASTRKRSVKHP